MLGFASQVINKFSTLDLKIVTNKFMTIETMFENWSNVQQEMLLNGKVVSNLISDLKSEETCGFTCEHKIVV